jgi:hypothetical protein
MHAIRSNLAARALLHVYIRLPGYTVRHVCRGERHWCVQALQIKGVDFSDLEKEATTLTPAPLRRLCLSLLRLRLHECACTVTVGEGVMVGGRARRCCCVEDKKGVVVRCVPICVFVFILTNLLFACSYLVHHVLNYRRRSFVGRLRPGGQAQRLGCVDEVLSQGSPCVTPVLRFTT